MQLFKTAFSGIMFFVLMGLIGWQAGVPAPASANDVSVKADEGDDDNNKCNNATLKGTYTFANRAWRIEGDEIKVFAVAGIETYDGRGHARGIKTFNDNGSVTRLVSYTATYQVRGNCTARYTATDENEEVTKFDYFVDPSGDNFFFIQTDKEFLNAGQGVKGSKRRVDLD